MWLFTQYGFYSVVQHNEDANRFLLRARVKNDLQNLLRLTELDLEVLKVPHADYAYRVVLTRAEWDVVSRLLAHTVDYPNFKDRIHDLPDQRSKNNAYMTIWSLMRQIAEPSPAQIGEDRNAPRQANLPSDAEPSSAFSAEALALFAEAETLMQQGEVAEAMGRVESLIENSPEFPGSYFLKGFVLDKIIKRHDEAVEALKIGLRLDPAQSGGWRMLAISLMFAGRAGEAVETLSPLIEREPDAIDLRLLQGFAYATMRGLHTPGPLANWLETFNPNSLDLYDAPSLYLLGLHFLAADYQSGALQQLEQIETLDEHWAALLKTAIESPDGIVVPQWEKDNEPLRAAIARFGSRPTGEGLEIIVRALQAGWGAVLNSEVQENDEGTTYSVTMGPLPQADGKSGLPAFTSREASRLFAGDAPIHRTVQGGDSLLDLALLTNESTHGEMAVIVLDPVGPHECVLPLDEVKIIVQAPPTTLLFPGTKGPRTIFTLEDRGLLLVGDKLELVKLPQKNLDLPQDARRATYLGNNKVRWAFDNGEYTLSSLCQQIVRQFGGKENPGTFQGPAYWGKVGSGKSLAALAQN